MNACAAPMCTRTDTHSHRRQSRSAAVKWLTQQIATHARSGCWPWPFRADQDGYGMAYFALRNTRATHIALILDGQFRPSAPNDKALHSCDNPSCVNPSHLRWGTAQDNNNDKVVRGRVLTGEECAGTRLTEDQVIAIYRRFVPGLDSNASELAKEFGVARSTIRFIGIGQTWSWLTKHVPVERPNVRRRQTATCGTDAGYYAHRRAGEPTCAPCRAAHSADQKSHRARQRAAKKSALL